jgi:hypothetical protein
MDERGIPVGRKFINLSRLPPRLALPCAWDCVRSQRRAGYRRV